jgi:hypothetical protein
MCWVVALTTDCPALGRVDPFPSSVLGRGGQRQPLGPSALAVLNATMGSASQPASSMAACTSHFAAVSTAAAATSPAAQDAVLQAIAAEQQTEGSKRVTALRAVAVGAVLMALDQMHSGRAPGPDGILVEFWRVRRGAWAPLLARLFSLC